MKNAVSNPTIRRKPRKRPGRKSKTTPKVQRKQTFFTQGRCR